MGTSRGTRHFLLLCLGSLLLLSGCGDKEPEQRKAFAELLNTQVLAVEGAIQTTLSAVDKKKIGNYARYFDVLAQFTNTLRKETEEKLQNIMQSTTVSSVSDAVDKMDTIRKAKDALKELSVSLQKQVDKAQAAKAKLQVPEGLKEVYETAYAKAVGIPSEVYPPLLKAADESLGASLALLEYVKKNKGGLVLSGQTINVRDPGLQEELDRLLKAVTKAQIKINNAYLHGWTKLTAK